jgi:glutathione synthetase
VFVVQPNEANSIDQRWIEYNLMSLHGIRVVRKTMREMQAEAILDATQDGRRRLFVAGREVAVAYYRSAYTPDDYPSDLEWQGRELIERSYAIKCPSIAHHLAGTKKVQQVLADATALRRFVSDDEAALLETSFAGLWGLEKDSDKTASVKQMAIDNARARVLKPQREGGGNNLYGDEVAEAMKTMSPEELESYILMERIFPKENAAVRLRLWCTSSLTMGGMSNILSGIFGRSSCAMVSPRAVRPSANSACTSRRSLTTAARSSTSTRATCCARNSRAQTKAAWPRASPWSAARCSCRTNSPALFATPSEAHSL